MGKQVDGPSKALPPVMRSTDEEETSALAGARGEVFEVDGNGDNLNARGADAGGNEEVGGVRAHGQKPSGSLEHSAFELLEAR
jgi:hypothetical protein